MANGCISSERILEKLDEYLNKNDYDSAERHLLYWHSEAEANSDYRTLLLMSNELMGLYRKLGKREKALEFAEKALAKIEELDICEQVGSATTYLNSATVFKAFGMADRSLPLFEKAREIYESNLKNDDDRLAGLYNNMALSLVDLRRFDEADSYYKKAISIMEKQEDGAPNIAITYLNMASAAEAEKGLEDGAELIGEYLEAAKVLLEDHTKRDGYYAFVCEKCASVFGYYGHFFYEKELKERAKDIYERN